MSRVLPPASGRGVVVVLGFPGSNPLFRAVQRWRVAMGLETARRFECRQIVLTGGVTRSSVSEAAQMAAHAVELGWPAGDLLLEERSRTTWENVKYTRSLVAEADVDFVVLVSDALHTRRALRDWRIQDPGAAVFVDPSPTPRGPWWITGPSFVANAAKIGRDRLLPPRRQY